MKLKILITTLTCLYATGLLAQTGYTINGDIKNLPDGITFYLIHNTEDGRADTVLQTKSKNQKFSFKGKLKEEGQLFFVKMDTSIIKITKNKESWARLFLDNSGELIQLLGDLKAWPEISIKGSKLTEDHDHYFMVSAPFYKKLVEDYNEKIDMAKKDLGKIAEAKKEYSEKFIRNLENISSSYVVPFILYNNAQLVPEIKERAYRRLSENQKNSYYGKRLKQYFLTRKMSESIAIGKPIPDFLVKNQDGKMESIRNLAIKSKYTLIDFWAYWCAPCRADIPNMKKVYNSFHDKGFNIISISTDFNDIKWKQALKEENTPWINGMQDGNVDSDIFGITAIPAYLLINERGEILQMDMISSVTSKSVGTMNGSQVFVVDKQQKRLRGEDLYKVMEELLGE